MTFSYEDFICEFQIRDNNIEHMHKSNQLTPEKLYIANQTAEVNEAEQSPNCKPIRSSNLSTNVQRVRLENDDILEVLTLKWKTKVQSTTG